MSKNTIWMRLGVSVDLTDEEYKALLDEGLSNEDLIQAILKNGRIDGDSYVYENDTEYEFNLPSTPLQEVCK